MLKYDSDVCCVVVMCKLFVVTALLCATPCVSVNVKSSSQQTLKQLEATPFVPSKYDEHQINETIENTSNNMEFNDTNKSHGVDDKLNDDWWSKDIWNHLHEKNKIDNNDTHHNFSNNDELNYEYYYDYDEFFPSYNDSTLKEYEVWKNYWSSHLQQLAFHPLDKNKTIVDNIQISHNITAGNLSTSPSLRDIIIDYYVKGLIGNPNNNHTDKPSHVPIKNKYPRWENLTSEEKLHLVKKVQGDPQRYSKTTTIGLTTYYGALLSVGIPGNGLTILIILTNSYMRTAPNFFLLNIAMADLLTLTMGKPQYLCLTVLHYIIY